MPVLPKSTIRVLKQDLCVADMPIPIFMPQIMPSPAMPHSVLLGGSPKYLIIQTSQMKKEIPSRVDPERIGPKDQNYISISTPDCTSERQEDNDKGEVGVWMVINNGIRESNQTFLVPNNYHSGGEGRRGDGLVEMRGKRTDESAEGETAASERRGGR